MKNNQLIFALALGIFAAVTPSCMSDNDDTIIVESGNSTDIPSDSKAKPNPEVSMNNVSIPNIQYATVDEDGTAVMRLDMTGIQDRNTLEWLRLAGTGERDQNVWVEVDGKPKGIKVYNTADDEEKHIVPVDLIFLVDNSGSMSEEADAIARDITAWAEKLAASSLDIKFGCVGYDGRITGACSLCDATDLFTYFNRSTGTSRTVGFEGSADEVSLYNRVRGNYYIAQWEESAMAALRFADDNFKFRTGANRVYVNFTDEPNQGASVSRLFSVESLKTDWETYKGTIHTVFSDGTETSREYNYLMSEYTGGTVINTNSSFTGVTLDSLPVSGAMMNSYIIRFTDIEEYMDGQPHEVKITIYSPDGSVQAERVFYVVFGDRNA